MKISPFLTILGALFLTIVSFGVFWTGLNQWVQAAVSFLFLLLGYVSMCKTKDIKLTIGCSLCGMLPLGSIMLMFRDMNNSHALEIAIVGSWIVAVVAGAYAAKQAKVK